MEEGVSVSAKYIYLGGAAGRRPAGASRESFTVSTTLLDSGRGMAARPQCLSSTAKY
jgi:hypothetical protein